MRKTEATTIAQYVSIYAGPEQRLYAQYATLQVIVFTTFLYGLFIPLLFPVALIFFINQNISDKILLTYFFRKPPMYNDNLTEKMLSNLRVAPILMFIFSYWVLTNAQMFFNVVPNRNFFNRAPNPKHNLHFYYKETSVGTFAFVILLIWFLRVAFDSFSCHSNDEDQEVEDENLPNYWRALPGHR